MPSLFHLDHFVCRDVESKKFHSIEKRERKILLQTLQQIRDTELNIYRQHAAYSNVHCYLLLSQVQDPSDGDDEEDDEENLKSCLEMIHETLEKDPSNLIALDLKVNILKEQNLLSGIEQLKCKLDTTNPIQKANAQAEIAFYLSKLDYRLYPIASELLEESLKELNENEGLKIWMYELSAIYNKMLNKDFAKCSNVSYDDIYSRIQRLLSPIIHSDHVLKYRAMVDLSDAYKKARIYNPDLVLLNGYTDDSLFKHACNKCPNDSHVLERYGRHLRYKAMTRQFDSTWLHEAKEALVHAVSICPRRHVAWHQLGLTYRALWLAANNMQGDKRKSAKPKKKRVSQKHVKCINHEQNLDITTLRAYNPSCKGTSQVEYLTEAKSCLEKANKYCKSSVYLVDLARVSISLLDRKLAKICLDKACKRRVRCSQSEEVIFYEQLALFRIEEILPKLMNNDMSHESQVEDIKQLLFKAIQQAHHTKVKPIDAYYLLRFLLLNAKPKLADISQQLCAIDICMGYYMTAEEYLDKAPESGSSLRQRIDLYEKQCKYSEAYFLLRMMLRNKLRDIKDCYEQLIDLACLAMCHKNTCIAQKDIYLNVFNLLFEESQNSKTDPYEITATKARDITVKYNFMLLVEVRCCRLVELLESMLEKFGFSVFIVSADYCDDLTPGSNMISVPQEKIKNADLVLACYRNSELINYHISNMIASQLSHRLILIEEAGHGLPSEWKAIQKVSIAEIQDSDLSDENMAYLFHRIMRDIFACIKNIRQSVSC